jgi:hypothetical protein
MINENDYGITIKLKSHGTISEELVLQSRKIAVQLQLVKFGPTKAEVPQLRHNGDY